MQLSHLDYLLAQKRSYKNFAVIGLGFGDEGKGVTVNSLCHNLKNPLVIRYSGGQQAGHTVKSKDGTTHIFSNFGSGSFKKVPTYWSKYCTFDPVGTMKEFDILYNKGITPKLYIDKNCPITTPYDKMHNQNSEAIKHGTCGCGVGATHQREERFYSLLVGDLLHPTAFRIKMNLIKQYYGYEMDIEPFIEACEQIMDRMNASFIIADGIPFGFDNFIYEGSQGLLLDQNIGFFPHVTRSSVGTKNVVSMCELPLKIFVVTRAFQTRHGNGPMTNEFIPNNIKDNPHETNVTNQYQGQFKRSLLDLDLLQYGISRDNYIQNSDDKELVITCLDLVKDEYRYILDGEIISHADEDSFVEGIAKELGIKKVHRISSPDGIFDLEVEEAPQNGQYINRKG